MTTATGERPICSCGEPMLPIRSTEHFVCAHCDSPCPKTELICVNDQRLSKAIDRKIHTTAPGADIVAAAKRWTPRRPGDLS